MAVAVQRPQPSYPGVCALPCAHPREPTRATQSSDETVSNRSADRQPRVGRLRTSAPVQRRAPPPLRAKPLPKVVVADAAGCAGAARRASAQRRVERRHPVQADAGGNRAAARPAACGGAGIPRSGARNPGSAGGAPRHRGGVERALHAGGARGGDTVAADGSGLARARGRR